VECKCKNNHSCDLKNGWATPTNLLQILKNSFNLQVEGCADSLHLSHVFPRYVSPDEEDKFFGGEHDILKIDLAGTSTYINPPLYQIVNYHNSNMHIINAILLQIQEWLKPNMPTRIIFLIPEPSHTNGKEFINNALNIGGNIIYSFPPSTFPFIPPNHFANGALNSQYYKGYVHIVIFENELAKSIYPYSLDIIQSKIKYWLINPHTQPIVSSASYGISLDKIEVNYRKSRHLYKAHVLNMIMDWNTHLDPMSLLCGFLPQSMINLIKYYNPKDFKDVIEDFRLKIIELFHYFFIQCSSRLDNLKSKSDLKCPKQFKNRFKIDNVPKFSNNDKVNSSIKKRKISNVHLKHQDRKKRMKKDSALTLPTFT